MEKFVLADSKLISMTEDEVKAWVKSFKPIDSSDSSNFNDLEYTLAQLKTCKVLDLDINCRRVEDYYQEFIKEDIEDNFDIKAEFLLDCLFVFVGNCHLTRCQKIVERFACLAEKYPENKTVCEKYILAILFQPTKTFCLRDNDEENNFKLIEELIKKFVFDEDTISNFEFYKICMKLKIKGIDKNLEYCTQITEMSIKSNSLLKIREATGLIIDRYDKKNKAKALELLDNLKNNVDKLVHDDIKDRDLISTDMIYDKLVNTTKESKIDLMSLLYDKVKILLEYWELRGTNMRRKLSTFYLLAKIFNQDKYDVKEILTFKRNLEGYFELNTKDDYSHYYKII